MENNITGTCYCGSVHFELKNNPKFVVNCHCNDCKKRNGGAFSTYLVLPEDDLVISDDKNTLTHYEAENIGIKYFCSTCGSFVYNKNYRLPGLYLLSYGALSKPENFTPGFNVFCESKDSWVDTIGEMKSFPGPASHRNSDK